MDRIIKEWLMILSSPASCLLVKMLCLPQSILCLFLLLATAIHLPAAEAEKQFEERIAKLGVNKKLQLAENIKKLHDLKPAEQLHLVKLQERIEAHPESATLNAIMENFHDWFEKLSDQDRMHFRKLVKDDERIAFIREMQERERRLTMKNLALNLSSKDEEAIYTWASSFPMKQKARFMYNLPPDIAKKFEAIGDENKRALAATCMLFMKRMGGPGFNPLRPAKEDFEKLKTSLSADAIKLIEKQPDEHSRMLLVHTWVLNVLWKKAAPEATPAKLAAFEKSLPGNRRDQLERLTNEDREREMRVMYVMASLIGFRPGEWIEHGEGDRPPSLFNFFGKGGPGGPGPEGRGPDGRGPDDKGGEPRGKGFENSNRPFPEAFPPERPPPGKK